MSPYSAAELLETLPRLRYLIVAFALAASAQAAELVAHRDLAYGNGSHERQKLDVYAPAGAKDRPVVVWIHGGGWSKGDKSQMTLKPRTFVERGYVFVAPNRRFVPDATAREILGDTARAIGWVHEHIAEYGGDPGKIFVIGHSSGAYHAAIICTDLRYLKAAGVPSSAIRGCVPLDTGVYDIPAQKMNDYTKLFGDPDSQRELSPINYVEAGPKLPPFLVVYIDHPFTKTQSEEFTNKLRDGGGRVTAYFAEDKTHGALSLDIGKPDDKPTEVIFKFLEQTLAP
jgi:acetyl esterase/lipase